MRILDYIPRFIKDIYKFISSNIQNVFRTTYRDHIYIAQANAVSILHQKTFGSYKNCYNDKEIAIIATGPSLKKYIPIDSVINIGVNKALLYNKVNLDYFFAIDYNATKDYIENVLNYPNLKCFYASILLTKFTLKELVSDGKYLIPESVINRHNAGKFYIYSKYPLKDYPLTPDIDINWLAIGCSCIFPAMQFALFTNPKRIYLVGCDCTSGHYDENHFKIKQNKVLIRAWQELKKFADIYYPETEIISVNPVGLKGLFKDMYQ